MCSAVVTHSGMERFNVFINQRDNAISGVACLGLCLPLLSSGVKSSPAEVEESKERRTEFDEYPSVLKKKSWQTFFNSPRCVGRRYEWDFF